MGRFVIVAYRRVRVRNNGSWSLQENTCRSFEARDSQPIDRRTL
jgi:hypothetical protein